MCAPVGGVTSVRGNGDNVNKMVLQRLKLFLQSEHHVHNPYFASHFYLWVKMLLLREAGFDVHEGEGALDVHDGNLNS